MHYAHGMISLPTKRFSLSLAIDGRAHSLKRNGNGPELLAPSNSPVMCIVSGNLRIPLASLALAESGAELLACSDSGHVRVSFDVVERPGHLAFLLRDVEGLAGRFDLTFRLELAFSGQIGDVIATVHGGADAVGLQGLTSDSTGSAAQTERGSAVWVTLSIRADCPSGGVALFACPGGHALDAIGEIEVTEGLPHPVAGGVWAKQSRATMGSYLAADFSPDELPEAIGFAERAGLRTLYLPPWIWASGTGSQTPGLGGWAATLGHFGVNANAFPGGETELRAVADGLEAKGLGIGAHTMSSWISPDDSYVTPVPHPDLAGWASGVLSGDITSEDTEIHIEGDTPFSHTSIDLQGEWYGFTVARLGDELVGYDQDITPSGAAAEGCNCCEGTGRHRAALRNCKRGLHGTLAAAHRKGQEAALLVQAYGNFVADPESSLLVEQAAQMAHVMNACRLSITSFDGLEALNFRGEWGMNRFVEAVFRRWDHHVVCDASQFHHFLWHMISRGNWGENMIDLQGEVERRARVDNIARQRRNLVPAALGWWPIRPRTLDYEATNTDDFEYLLAKCAGYDACFCIESSIKAMREHPQTGLILDLVKEWEHLRHSGAFTKEQRNLLRTTGLSFRLTGAGDRRTVTPVKTDRPVHAIAPAAGQSVGVPVDNTFGAQQLRFTIRVLQGLDRAASGSVSLLPEDPASVRPGPQPGSLRVEAAASTTGAPAYRLTCDYEEPDQQITPPGHLTRHSDGSASPPYRFHWSIEGCRILPRFENLSRWPAQGLVSPGQTVDLSEKRGLGMWLDAGEGCPGALLFVEIVAPGSGNRQYYASLDQPGRRWVEWPNGEASSDRYYDYDWWRGPEGSPWSVLKWCDYSKVAKVRVGIIGLQLGSSASVVVEGLRALPEAKQVFSAPAFHLGGQELSILGNVQSGHYLAYEGGETAAVFDENWAEVKTLPVRGRLSVPQGKSEVRIGSEGYGLQPWLGIRMRVVGPDFEVISPDPIPSSADVGGKVWS